MSWLSLNFFLLLFSLSILVIFTKFTSKTSPSIKGKQLPPGPAPWLLLGNLPDFLKNKPAFRWIHGFMAEMKTEIACIQLGNVHIIPVTSPEISREFLKKHDAVFASRPNTTVSEYSSGGFLSIAVVPKGEQWKKMRRIVASNVINQTTFKWLHHKRREEADNLVRFIYNQISNTSSSVINVRNTVRQYSGNVSRKMIFGNKGNKDGGLGIGIEEEEHAESLFTVLAHLFAFSLSDYFPWMRVLDLDGHGKTVREAMDTINKYHDPIVDSRVQQWKKDGGKKKIEDLLDILISVKDTNGQPLLSVAEIKAQCTDLMLAAVDNPPNAVEWAMAEMINQPEVMGKAMEEIDRVVGKQRLVQESDFENLNYVKACVREAFRLHPVSPFNLPHVSTSDAVVAGYFIPKGSHVLLSRLGLGRNGRVWEEPLRFKPERHLIMISDDTGKKTVELTEPELRFISFSTGRRGCPGIMVGSAMTVMLLARLLQGFSWSAPPGEKEIDLSESRNGLSLEKPLHAVAKPRLHPSLYAGFNDGNSDGGPIK